MLGPMSTHSIPVAVLGATGYAGEGTVKALLGHPHFHLVHVGSDRLGGQSLASAVPELAGQCDLTLAPDSPEAIRTSGAEAIILCKKSPEVTQVVPDLLAAGLRIVDIGAEFRLHNHADYRLWHGDAHACPELLGEAVYGLSEIHHQAIARARVVGNPGCYATSILLPLIPLLQAGLVDLSQDISAIGYSGVSGAGKRFVEANNNLFYAMSGNLHSYRAIGHQHCGEIGQECSAAAGAPVQVRFIPHLAPLVRGIHSTITLSLRPGLSAADCRACWQSQYQGRTFIRLRPSCREVEVGHVSGSNFCDMAVDGESETGREHKVVITSALDNLVKGASGQAVQNLNLMYGLEEHCGLLARFL
ncbi:MAG: N-acetyl-gamma-glutamyl-phosphate reductase [Planctomycetota bacterium]|nr:MAG: N-acetyl-gamma-glutamyl-phosphate reductase [Planctomycetota bacterium]